jgi:hypothetical protein
MSKSLNSFNINAFVEKEKLKTNGSNFTDWHRTMRIILAGCKKDYVIAKTLGNEPGDGATADEISVHETRKDDYMVVKCVVLYSLESELQKRFENHDGAFEIVEELKTMFEVQARAERYDISEKFFTCKMDEGSSVSEHAIKMTGYTQRLEALGCKIPDELKADRVLQSLPLASRALS